MPVAAAGAVMEDEVGVQWRGGDLMAVSAFNGI
jgi:hypothetical protein